MEEEWSRLSAADRERLLHNARQRLEQAGAHYTAPSVAECDSILDSIDARLESGERP
jgi:phosphonoacetaldehyde hydrolase